MPDKILDVVCEYTGAEEVTVPDGGAFDTIDDVLTIYDAHGKVLKQFRGWRSVGWVMDAAVQK